MTIQAAYFELVECAAKMRPDWDRTAFEGALQACRTAGLDWARTWRLVTVVITDEDGQPRDIVEAVRNPLRRNQVPPGDAALGAELARTLLAEQGIGIDPEPPPDGAAAEPPPAPEENTK